MKDLLFLLVFIVVVGRLVYFLIYCLLTAPRRAKRLQEALLRIRDDTDFIDTGGEMRTDSVRKFIDRALVESLPARQQA